jgi:hypothetical protein
MIVLASDLLSGVFVAVEAILASVAILVAADLFEQDNHVVR